MFCDQSVETLKSEKQRAVDTDTMSHFENATIETLTVISANNLVQTSLKHDVCWKMLYIYELVENFETVWLYSQKSETVFRGHDFQLCHLYINKWNYMEDGRRTHMTWHYSILPCVTKKCFMPGSTKNFYLEKPTKTKTTPSFFSEAVMYEHRI